MTTSSWGLGQRIAFRFGFLVAGHLAPEPLLATRGFRWINDEPFNR
jgi:hypothetical protein